MSVHQLIRQQATQHDLFNRLHSIAADQAFVQRVRDVWFEQRFVVVANQRCGIWYCDPATTSSAYAYFKSTDGHTSIWNFSLRRSNLAFATYAEKEEGVILVDATRRGKRMPDALSKTVPIWCTVINRAIALRRSDDGLDWDTELYLPPQIVSSSERAQIEARIDGWAVELERSALALPDLAKPLRPFFLHPGTTVPPTIPPRSTCGFTPIICLSASRWIGKDPDQSFMIARSLGDAFDYVMGSGDDEELWGRGLTSSLYHRHKEQLLAASRDDLPSLVDRLIGSVKLPVLEPKGDVSVRIDDVVAHGIPSSSSPIGISLPLQGGEPWAQESKAPVVISIVPCKVPPRAFFSASQLPTGSRITIPLSSPKTHGAEFIQALGIVYAIAQAALSTDTRIAVSRGEPADFVALEASVERDAVSTGFQGDLEAFNKAATEGVVYVGILLLILGVDNDGERRTDASDVRPTKKDVETRLHWLMSVWPHANVARAGLKRVNEFMMAPGRQLQRPGKPIHGHDE